MKKINSIVDRVLFRLGLLEAVRRQMAVEVWPKVAGKRIAARTKPLRIKDGVLIVSVPEAALRNELTLRRMQLVKKYHQLGYECVRNIKFVR